jgi:hypothetical protein
MHAGSTPEMLPLENIGFGRPGVFGDANQWVGLQGVLYISHCSFHSRFLDTTQAAEFRRPDA